MWQMLIQWALVGLTVYAWARVCTIEGWPAWAVAAGAFAIGAAGAQRHSALIRSYEILDSTP